MNHLHFIFWNLYSIMKDEMRDTMTEYMRRINEREKLNENFMFLSQEKLRVFPTNKNCQRKLNFELIKLDM